MSILKGLKKLLAPLDSTPKEQPRKKLVIWGVIEGPIMRDEFPEDELQNLNIPDDAEAMLVCKIEEDGAVGVCNMWYASMDEAYEIKKYFDKNIEPLEVDI